MREQKIIIEIDHITFKPKLIAEGFRDGKCLVEMDNLQSAIGLATTTQARDPKTVRLAQVRRVRGR